MEGEPRSGPLGTNTLVGSLEVVRVEVELGVVGILEKGGSGVLRLDGAEGPVGRAGRGDAKDWASQGAALVNTPLSLNVDHLP